MLLGGITNTARALAFYTRRQELASNNVANVNTPGFKADLLAAAQSSDMPHPVPVEGTDLTQGTVETTGRPLDLALEGDGFFVLQTPHGERLTRGGSFRLDGAGRVVDHAGNPLLGDGGPLVVVGSPRVAGGGEGGAELRVGADGTVEVGGTPVGRIRLERAATGTRLLKEGENRYRAEGATEQVEAATTTVRQGALESANFDAVGSMIDLVTIQRMYGATLDAVRTLDGVLAAVTTEVGKT